MNFLRDYDVVMFDIGGVLLELGSISELMALTSRRWTKKQLWKKWLLSDSGRAFESGRIGPEQFAEAMVDEFALNVDAATYLEVFTNWIRAPYPGTFELLGSLKGRCRRACLSNTNVLHWKRMADGMGLARHFEHVFPSHLTGRIKPDVEAFAGALTEMQVEPQRVLFFDDSPVNVDAARKLGIAAHRVDGVDGVKRALGALAECGYY